MWHSTMKIKGLVKILIALAMTLGLVIFFLQKSGHEERILPKPSQAPTEEKHTFSNPGDTARPVVKIPAKKPSPVPSSSATPPEPQYEISSPTSNLRATDIVVPHGARVPAVLMDAGAQDDSPEVRNIMDGIVEQFAETIREAKRTNSDMQKAWEEARDEADARYRFFFGFDAFNAATIQTAGEAADEATATSRPPAQ
ncbi:hypothetical protein EBU02_07235 [bacterium]|nr:hypothetical protein [bacterium]NBS53105.1 hypothetical protein [Spartobacteria bacterium]